MALPSSQLQETVQYLTEERRHQQLASQQVKTCSEETRPWYEKAFEFIRQWSAEEGGGFAEAVLRRLFC